MRLVLLIEGARAENVTSHLRLLDHPHASWHPRGSHATVEFRLCRHLHVCEHLRSSVLVLHESVVFPQGPFLLGLVLFVTAVSSSRSRVTSPCSAKGPSSPLVPASQHALSWASILRVVGTLIRCSGFFLCHDACSVCQANLITGLLLHTLDLLLSLFAYRFNRISMDLLKLN